DFIPFSIFFPPSDFLYVIRWRFLLSEIDLINLPHLKHPQRLKRNSVIVIMGVIKKGSQTTLRY
ncbi:hypothetical protein BU644_10830, partial [Staphylococcus chromogenes]